VVNDLVRLAQAAQEQKGSEKWRQGRKKFRPRSRSLIDQVTTPGGNLVEAICKAVLGAEVSPTDGLPAWKVAILHCYDVVMACVFAHAILGRFVSHLLLQPSPSCWGAYEALDAAEESPFQNAPPGGRNGHYRVLPGQAECPDLLAALAETVSSGRPEAITELVAREVASRLGLPAVDDTLKARVRLYADRFLALALEATDIERGEAGLPPLYRPPSSP
jgi:hypothetical protein